MAADGPVRPGPPSRARPRRLILPASPGISMPAARPRRSPRPPWRHSPRSPRHREHYGVTVSVNRRSRARNVRFYVLILSVVFMFILSDREQQVAAVLVGAGEVGVLAAAGGADVGGGAVQQPGVAELDRAR